MSAESARQAARALYAAAVRSDSAEAWERVAVAYAAYATLLRSGLGVRHDDLLHIDAVIRHARLRARDGVPAG